MSKLILSLCDHSGAWSSPYRNAGYEVIQIDLQHGQDVRIIPYIDRPVHGILAAPPCTDFAVSGARWWKKKGERPLLDSLALVDACLRQVAIHKPKFWALENPVGRISAYLGSPTLWFQPCDYGDPYTKKTGLWGMFNNPKKNPVEPTLGSAIHKMWSSMKNERSRTPDGFSKAFFEANP